MVVVTRYVVPLEDQSEFRATAGAALSALVGGPGCSGGQLARSIDDPLVWILVTHWESVGAYRRALSSWEVKVAAVPLLSRAIDEPSAFEELLTWTPSAGFSEQQSDLAADPVSASARKVRDFG